MKEIWRNFEGKLDVDNQSGIIVSLTESKKYHITFLSVLPDNKTELYMIPMSQEIDWNNFDFGEMASDINNGRINGEIFYKEKWRNPQKIQEVNKNYNWRNFCQ